MKKSSVHLEDRSTNNHNPPTVHIGDQGYDSAVPPADVAVADGAAVASGLVHAKASVGGAAAGVGAVAAGDRGCGCRGCRHGYGGHRHGDGSEQFCQGEGGHQLG